MLSKSLFHRDFSLMVLGQIISLFGNSILRFALSLYVLDLTGSATVFGTILAVSMIPTVLLSPVGGVFADRVNRRNIMVCLDYATFVLISVFLLTLGVGNILLHIGVVLVLLQVIQACYQPSVQASIPVLAPAERLVQANGIVAQVNALANLLGPIAGGLAYGMFGLKPILVTSLVCFFASATMELFIRIPFKREDRSGGALKGAVSDLKEAVGFLTKQKPALFQLLLVVAGLNFFLSAMVTVGLPYIIKITLGLSSQQYGFAEAAMGVGSILGGIFAGVCAKRVIFKNVYLFLIGAAGCILPVGLSLTVVSQPLVSYAVILIFVMACMAFAALFTIFAQTAAQRMTPNHLLGKVSSFIAVIAMCVFPLGQAVFGVLFDLFHSHVFVVVLGAGVASALIAVLSRPSLRKLNEAQPQVDQAAS